MDVRFQQEWKTYICGAVALGKPEGQCTKLHTVVASTNRGQPPQSLHCCLFAPLTYAYFSFTSRSWCVAHSAPCRPRCCNKVPFFLQRTAPIARSLCKGGTRSGLYILVTAPFCYYQRARATNAQSFILRQQATTESTAEIMGVHRIFFTGWEGGSNDILLNFFKLLTINRKWTLTKRFTFLRTKYNARCAWASEEGQEGPSPVSFWNSTFSYHIFRKKVDFLVWCGKMQFHHFSHIWKNLFGYLWKNHNWQHLEKNPPMLMLWQQVP